MNPQAEYIDVIDEEGNVVGRATKEQVIKNKLLHRGANVFVFNSKGELFVHKRSNNLLHYPGMYDVKFSGDLRSGENYYEAAKRELQEEAGIKDTNLEFLFELRTRRKEENVDHQAFSCVWNGPIALDPRECEYGKFMTLEEIKILMGERKLSPSAEQVFEEFLKRRR